MTFGLVVVPPSFIGAVTCTLRPLLRECIILFFEDILVFSKMLEQHVEHLRQVLQLLKKDHWQAKQSKCAFGQRKIAYLGHVISEQGVATDPAKTETVRKWLVPHNSKEVRASSDWPGTIINSSNISASSRDHSSTC